MSWMKRRGQPSPNPTNSGVPMYNPNQHSNTQQPYQQWPQQQQQPPQQPYNNDWYGQQQQQQKGPSKTPPTSQYPSNTNYWQQQQQQPSYNQSSQNFNTSIGHQNLSNLPQHQQQQQQQQPPQLPPINQYHQQPQQQYNNQFPTNQHQNYYQNTNNYPQDNFIQQQYAQPQQTQNYYQQQQQQAAATTTTTTAAAVAPNVPQQAVGNNDADPWNWDWEDNSNANSQSQKPPQVPPTQNEQPPNPNQNQNNITDSFANDESWNWSVEESSSSQSLSQKTETESIVTTNLEQQQQVEATGTKIENNIDYQNTNAGAIIDELPGLPNLRRIKNESLTPQWSIESQVSQDSSEDVLLTSESDNRSNILSQSSTTSHSPTRQPDQDYLPSSSSPSQIYVQNVQVAGESEFYQENTSNKQTTSYLEHIDKGMEELHLNAQVENKEIVSPEGNVEESAKKTMPLNVNPPPIAIQANADLKNPYKKNNKGLSMSKPLIATVQKAPSAFAQIRPSSSENISPRPESTENNLGVNLETVPDNSERPDMESAVQKLTTPTLTSTASVDSNSSNKSGGVRKTTSNATTVQQQWAENCEIAPINDRNQYLETGQLSDTDIPVYNQSGNEYQMDKAPNTSVSDANDSLPPPGLCRLVLGQMEQAEATQSNDNTIDAAPPPGLSRKVIGSTAPTYPNARTRPISQPPADYSYNEEPPAGLHRMVPGESSSPESSTYMYQTDATVFQAVNFDDADNYVSESELNQMGVNLVSQRSATIGADTPPVTNQQTLSNTGYSSSSSVDPTSSIPSREGAVGIDNEACLDKSDITSIQAEESKPSSLILPPENNRREDIDGGTEEYISNVVRDQTVGQNTTDDLNAGGGGGVGGNGMPTDKHRTNRTYTTDSEHEQPKERHNRSSSPSSRYDKDRRYYEERRHRGEREASPDRAFRDRKYEKRRHNKDRRYEDETDYYNSDKERSGKVRDEREDYDAKRFSSLRRDKDRDRRRERGDRREYDRNDYYFNNSRFDEDYYNRSRPSSRSDSMHDSTYRDRRHPERDSERSARHRGEREREPHRDRERDPHRRPRDPYNHTANYYQGYNYDPFHPYYQQYQYYEHLRRTNPQAYADLYRNYYQNQGSAVGGVQPGYSTEDRASVHSGRSSANDELKKDRYTRQSYYSQQSLPHYYRDIQIPNASSTAYTIDDSRLLDHTDSSLILEDSTTTTQRLTPAKFSTAHMKATIASGNFVNILPHYPLDGQPATVEIFCLQSILYEDEEQKDLVEFPGPLIKGTTHKKTIIEYCENKIKKATNNINDVDSYILMWELLILLLRQNGMVVGTDIAELLMKNRTFENNRRQSVSSSGSTQHLDSGHEQNELHLTTTATTTTTTSRTSPAMHYKEEYITDKFREYLIYGSGKEALEWAMKHGLWGHALFLASKLDKRTYANVMMRFANGLTMNDPLQTLYQLLSGRQPAAVTSVADEKWGDWRPHLAMILSNTSQRPDLDRKAITTLGDTLQQRGNLYAAHFCYLMAQLEFGTYGSAQNAKLVLLSSSHTKPFKAFATNEAIFMTEIYEYACSLSDATFNIPQFLPYKYLMATRMVDYGLLEKGLLYLERVAVNIKQDPSRTQPSLVSRVCELADRLKYCDPIQIQDDDGDLDSPKTEHTWLTELKQVLTDYTMGLITHQSASNLTSIEPTIIEQQQSTINEYNQQQQWQQQQQQSSEYYQPQQNEESQPWQQQQQQPTEQQQSLDYNNQQPTVNYQEGELQQQQQPGANYQDPYWMQQQQQQQQQAQPTWDENADSNNQQHVDDNTQQNDYWNSAAQSEQPPEQTKPPEIDEPRPQISMPNQSKSKNYFDSEENESKTSQQSAKSKPAAAAAKPASTGWFGGIWSKLALRPKNQMKLPDDKNPTIVWDSEKKRWVNLEEDNGDTATELKPPPKMSEMFNRTTTSPPSLPPPQMQQQNVAAMPNVVASTLTDNTATMNNQPLEETDKKPPSGSNMFKLQRGRNIKKAYVDVFNPGGNTKATANKSSIPSPEVFGSTAPVAVGATNGNQMNFFIPQPIADPNAPTDFLTTPTATPQEENNTQLSRWSSSSSLSREVQYYMQQRPRMMAKAKSIGGAPMMYNPNQFSNVGQSGNYPTH